MHRHKPAPARTGLPVPREDGQKSRKRKKRKEIASLLLNGGPKQVEKLSASKHEQVENGLGSNNTLTQRTRELGSETEELEYLHSSPSSVGVLPTYKHGDITTTGGNRLKPPQLVLQNGHSTPESGVAVKDKFGKLLGGTGQRTVRSKTEKKSTYNANDNDTCRITTPSITCTSVKGEASEGKLNEKCGNMKCNASPGKPVSSSQRRRMRRSCLNGVQPFPWHRAKGKHKLRHKLNVRKLARQRER